MGNAEIVKALLDHAGEVNATDKNGDTALHLAASNGHSAVVSVLLNPTTEMDVQTRSQLALNRVPAVGFEFSQSPKVDGGGISRPTATEDGNVEIADIQISHSSNVCRAAALDDLPAGYSESEQNVMINTANVNACNNAKMTALHLACRNGHTSIVEILLDNHPSVDVNTQSLKTPFYLAVKKGHADISDLLLRRGVCDFVQIDFASHTPLVAAVLKGHTGVAELIVKHSCGISDKLTKDKQKLQENAKSLVDARDVISTELFKCDGRRVSAEIVWKEIPFEIRTDFGGYHALIHPAFWVEPKMVRVLLSGDQCIYSDAHLRRTFASMIEATEREHFFVEPPTDLKQYGMYFREIAHVLTNSSKFNVNHQDSQLNTLCHYVMQHCACSSYLVPKLSKKCRRTQVINDLIHALLEAGADFNLKNSHGETPLIIASEKGSCDSIRILFGWEQKSGKKLDIDARDRYGATALIKAVAGNHVAAVQLLLNHKASVNLHDYSGFTALHAAIYERHRNWIDMHFFCKGLRKRRSGGDDSLQIDSKNTTTWRGQIVDPHTAFGRLQKFETETDRIREAVIQLLLASDGTDVNAVDVRGNTPLDLAVKFSKRITPATLEALLNHGAIRILQEPEDKAPIEMARIDGRGRNALHRLIISGIRSTDYKMEDKTLDESTQDRDRFDLMVHGIRLIPENFRQLAIATDDKGRTPLHYIGMQTRFITDKGSDLVTLLLKLGSSLNAADMYGKTPLHYAEESGQYNLLVQCGADENLKDKFENTPRDLKQLRNLVTINEDNAKKVPIRKKALCISTELAHVLGHVTELSKRKLIEMIRIYSQSPRPQESSEAAIWRIWTENDLNRLNSRLSQLKLSVKDFIQRLADCIKERDCQFECQPILVGSAEEETKVVLSADFDFNLQLIKFSQLCDPMQHPLSPKGYYELKRKKNDGSRIRSESAFDIFFNLDKCLLTNEVNSRFQIISEEVLMDPCFWQDENNFKWNLNDIDYGRYKKPVGLCKTVQLRMIHPVEDEDGGSLFVNISIDIAASIYMEDWWPEDLLTVDISTILKSDGCSMVFDRPRRDHSLFSETVARISFALVESRFIKECPLLLKAAFIVCKMILHEESRATYQLKTCLLFCMEAFSAMAESETRNEDEITPKQLAFWVERIMFCFLEFSRQDFYPCYFMPSFRLRVVTLVNLSSDTSEGFDEFLYSEVRKLFPHSEVYDIYLDLCPHGTSINIGRHTNGYECDNERSLSTSHDKNSEQFDREEFIRKLSSRICND